MFDGRRGPAWPNRELSGRESRYISFTILIYHDVDRDISGFTTRYIWIPILIYLVLVVCPHGTRDAMMKCRGYNRRGDGRLLVLDFSCVGAIMVFSDGGFADQVDGCMIFTVLLITTNYKLLCCGNQFSAWMGGAFDSIF